MSPEAQRIAIAEACGWRRAPDYVAHDPRRDIADRWYIPHSFGAIVNHLPDYLSDLNAVFAFADFLASKFDVQIIRHNNSLWKVQFTEPSREYTAISESLSEAICQAGLRALKMWSDE